LRLTAHRAQRSGQPAFLGGGDQARNIGGDNEFRAKTWFYCAPGGWLFSGSNTNRSKPPMRTAKPFVVIQNGKPIFTVHAYSLAAAKALVAAKVAGETIVVVVTRHGAVQ
jgi:hypothetical protein